MDGIDARRWVSPRTTTPALPTLFLAGIVPCRRERRKPRQPGLRRQHSSLAAPVCRWAVGMGVHQGTLSPVQVLQQTRAPEGRIPICGTRPRTARRRISAGLLQRFSDTQRAGWSNGTAGYCTQFMYVLPVQKNGEGPWWGVGNSLHEPGANMPNQHAQMPTNGFWPVGF